MRGPRLTLSAFKTSAKARAIRPLAVICLSSLLLLIGAGILASAAGLAPTLIISTPLQDDRIEDGFFTASGFARGGSDLSARVVTSQGEIRGESTASMKNYDWNFRFSTAAALDENVTLYVRISGSNGFTEQSVSFHWKTR
jgi:hypothetical protein